MTSASPTGRDESALEYRLRGADRRVGLTGRKLLTLVADHREVVLASSAAEIGARIGTSDATVVRTVQALGFAGLGDLKRTLLEAIAAGSTPAHAMRRTLADIETSTDSAVDHVLAAHADGIATLASASFRAQVRAAVRTLEPAARIVVFGIGPSAALSAYVTTMLARSGRRCRCLDATGSMLADQLLDLHAGDALLILAYGRLYREVTAVFREAKAMGLATVLMTEANGTKLASLADVVIAIPRGRPDNIALHGATLVGLEALMLALAAARPEAAVASLERLNQLRSAITSLKIPP